MLCATCARYLCERAVRPVRAHGHCQKEHQLDSKIKVEAEGLRDKLCAICAGARSICVGAQPSQNPHRIYQKLMLEAESLRDLLRDLCAGAQLNCAGAQSSCGGAQNR